MNLIKKEFKQILSNKMFIGLWIVIVVLLTFFMSTDQKKVVQEPVGAVIGIADEDDSTYSKLLVSFVTGSEEFSNLVSVKTGTKEQLQEQFMNGELDAYIEIPSNFISNMVDIKETPIVVKVSDKDSITAILVSNVITSYQDYIAAIQLNVTGLFEALEKLGFSEKSVNLACFNVTYVLVQRVFEKEDFIDEVKITDYKVSTVKSYFIYAAISIVIMYGALFAGVDILKEKSYWVLNRYLITGNSRLKFILTKVFFYSMSMYTLIFIPSIISSIVKHSKPNYLMLFLYLVYIVLSVSISVFLSFLTGKLNVYALTSNMMYIVSIIIGGGIIPIMYMPEKLQKIGEFTLTRLYIKNFIAVINGKTLSEIFTQILLCILVSVSLIAGSVYLFGKGEKKND